MVTRVDLIQTGAPSASAATTISTSPTVDYQAGDLVLAFARHSAATTETVSGVALTTGGALTAIVSPINIPSRTTVSGWYKIMTAAATGDTATATFSASVDYRGLDVIVYRPGSGGTLSVDGLPGSSQTGFPASSITTSAINTTGGGVLCAFIGGYYGDFNAPGPTVTAGYTKIGADTLFSAIAEKFPSTSLSSETITWAYSSGNEVAYSVAFLVAIKETSATYARPASDITKQWTPSSGTDHFAMIDEVTASDADYISATAAGQTTEVKLQAMTQPQAGTSVAIGYRVQGITSGAGVTVSMVQGTTVIATDTNRTSNGDYTLTVAPATWASVTDWTDIRLRFVST
jgi:hypothetical protein